MEEVAIDCLKLQTSLFGKWTNRIEKISTRVGCISNIQEVIWTMKYDQAFEARELIQLIEN